LIEKVYGSGMLLDIEKSFNTTWLPGFLYQLFKMELSDSIMNLISSFLFNRKFMVSFGGEMYTQVYR